MEAFESPYTVPRTWLDNTTYHGPLWWGETAITNLKHELRSLREVSLILTGDLGRRAIVDREIRQNHHAYYALRGRHMMEWIEARKDDNPLEWAQARMLVERHMALLDAKKVD
jgi:hypothetical protein